MLWLIGYIHFQMVLSQTSELQKKYSKLSTVYISTLIICKIAQNSCAPSKSTPRIRQACHKFRVLPSVQSTSGAECSLEFLRVSTILGTLQIQMKMNSIRAATRISIEATIAKSTRSKLLAITNSSSTKMTSMKRKMENRKAVVRRKLQLH